MQEAKDTVNWDNKELRLGNPREATVWTLSIGEQKGTSAEKMQQIIVRNLKEVEDLTGITLEAHMTPTRMAWWGKYPGDEAGMEVQIYTNSFRASPLDTQLAAQDLAARLREEFQQFNIIMRGHKVQVVVIKEDSVPPLKKRCTRTDDPEPASEVTPPPRS